MKRLRRTGTGAATLLLGAVIAMSAGGAVTPSTFRSPAANSLAATAARTSKMVLTYHGGPVMLTNHTFTITHAAGVPDDRSCAPAGKGGCPTSTKW